MGCVQGMTKQEITGIGFESFGIGQFFEFHMYSNGKLEFEGVHISRELNGKYEGFIHPKKVLKLLAHIERQRFDDLNYDRPIYGVDCEIATITVHRGTWTKKARVVIGVEPPELRAITRLILWLFDQSKLTKV
ncbi:hypothetical protein H70737_03615 [Paenibacillus sp. FSL H7-0737]|nr:hypothetical protein H70737_03615 [Paenibacillus sp. FSL H7-0737]